MTAAAPTGPRDLHRRTVRRMVLRPLGTVGLSVAVYYWLPLSDRSDVATVMLLVGGLATVGVVLAWHVRAIIRSDYPRMRAIETLALAAPMFLLVFAAAYYLMARSSTDNFGSALSRTDTLYFSVTVFSTTGFGDITPHSEDARLLVTGQMIGDMIFIGFGIRQLATATRVGLERRASAVTDPVTDQVVDPVADGEPGRPG
ncbi:potassium channel family protein [Virgisporangium aurantiacum]|uniref:Metal transporter n=1 Tax=Virgisporangium aurantiacum TaxID=175570 RepID=A0A8J3Z0W0_9ACTN|nr:potassium channel family protein [Virgisporangium aurantiacum]GIJ55594.1 metal transporter [Virgisporangium aurantiacum]